MREELTRRELLGTAGALGAGLSLATLLRANPAQAFAQLTAGKSLASLTVAEAAPRSLDVATSYVTNTQTIVYLTHEPLVIYSTDLKLTPLVAQSWTSHGPSKWVFKIRPNVKFSDGSALTTEDVVYSVLRHIDPKLGSGVAGFLANLSHAAATGPHEVTFSFKAPTPLFPHIATLIPMLKKSFAQPLGKRYGVPGGKILGTGPYTLVNFDPTSGVTLDRNPAYWGRPVPQIKQIGFKFISDTVTQRLAMQSGAIDLVFGVDGSEVGDWQKLANVKVLSGPVLWATYLSFDMSQAPWNDLHVRRAFAYAYDANGYVKSVLKGHAAVASAVVAPAMWKTLMSDSAISALYQRLQRYPYNLGQAKAELAKSSVPKGFSASVKYPSVLPESGKALLVLSESLSKIGVHLDVGEVNFDQWLSNYYAHKNLGLQTTEFSPDYNDPEDYLKLLLGSENAVANGLNVANYKNPQVDALFKQESATTNPKLRAKHLGKILEISQRDLPYLTLSWPYTYMAFRSDRVDYTGFSTYCFTQEWVRSITVR
jgi:peptide/nickel transport system substrate-binding protein